MRAADRAMGGFFTAALANRTVRNAAMNVLQAKLRKRSLGDRAGGCPAARRRFSGKKHRIIRQSCL